MKDMKGSSSSNVNLHALHKEWDEISCPICMEQPHNAVLLICASHEKGCRPYICDTSYRHSNCLDQLQKMWDKSSLSRDSPRSSLMLHEDSDRMHNHTSEVLYGEPGLMNTDGIAVDLFEDLVEDDNGRELHGHLEARTGARISGNESGEESEDPSKCPLCRGFVLGWLFVEDVRKYLDQKIRSCSRESCQFSGNYIELRRHARKVHPMTRPSDVDPSRQRAWRRLENQQEHGDILSVIRSATPGAIVLGDYAIDSGEAVLEDPEMDEGNGDFWSTFVLLHMISSPRRFGQTSSSSRARRTRRSSGHQNQNLWGENLLDLYEDDGNNRIPRNDVWVPRTRRRFT